MQIINLNQSKQSRENTLLEASLENFLYVQISPSGVMASPQVLEPLLTLFMCIILIGNLVLMWRRAFWRECVCKRFILFALLCMQQCDSELGLKRALLVALRGCRFIFVLRGWPPDEPAAALPFSILPWQRAAHGALSNCLPYLKYWQRNREGGWFGSKDPRSRHVLFDFQCAKNETP